MKPPKTARPYARQTREALGLLGQLIRATRIERGLKVHRIEIGDPSCGIGVVFEATTVLGLPLFAPEPVQLADERARLDEKLRLLPKSVHSGHDEVDDAF
jgi:hypothetical protein